MLADRLRASPLARRYEELSARERRLVNIGAAVAIAEPIHGSAPDIAGKGIANPTAVILSAAMLVRHHWNKPEIADRIDAAVTAALSKGDYTADILGANGMSTDQFADIICEQLG